jgi:hypothetical protein
MERTNGIESIILAQINKNDGLNGSADKFDSFCHPNFNHTLDKYLSLEFKFLFVRIFIWNIY